MQTWESTDTLAWESIQVWQLQMEGVYSSWQVFHHQDRFCDYWSLFEKLYSQIQQQQQRKVWGVLVTSSCNHMKCGNFGGEGRLQFYKLAGVRGHNTFSSRWGKEDKKKERKKKKSSGWSLTKGKKEEEEKLRLVRHGFDIFRILSDTLLMCDSLAQMGRGKKSEGDVGDGQGNRGSV